MHTGAMLDRAFTGEPHPVGRRMIADQPSISAWQARPRSVVRFLTRALVLSACSFLLVVSLVVPHPATAGLQKDTTTVQSRE
jgi:hypothetical protein